MNNSHTAAIRGKWLAILLALALVIGMIPAGVFADANDGKAEIRIGAPADMPADGYEPGDTFTVPVYIDYNPGFVSAGLNFTYDTSVLDVAGTEAETVSQENSIVPGSWTVLPNLADPDQENRLSVALIHLVPQPVDLDETGLLFNVSFKVKEDSAGGSFDLGIHTREDVAMRVSNAAGQAVPVNYTGTTFAVKAASDPVVLRVYTAESADTTAKTEVRAYRGSELLDLRQAGELEPVSGMLGGAPWRVDSTDDYITLEDLFEDAGIASEWKEGAYLFAAAADGFGETFRPYQHKYEVLENDSWFYPTLTGAQTTTDDGEATPAVLAMTEMSSTVGENETVTTGDAEAHNLANQNGNNYLRLIYGITKADAAAGSATGQRLISGVTSLTLVKAAPVDKTALDAAIADAEALNEADYTSASWATLAPALTAAQGVSENEDATQAAVDAALAALEDAMTDLVLAADKETLNAAITAAGALAEADYTPASWAALQAALAGANTVAADGNATQAAVDAALATLNNAMTDLDLAADKNALNAAIAAAGALVEAGYTADSWAALAAALVSANTVTGDDNATQQAVDAALTALNDAALALVQAAVPVDKTALEATITAAAALTEADYTADSWTAFAAALADAQAISANEGAIQSEVDAALTALNNAMNTLVASDADVVSNAALNAAITAAGALVEADYTADSWAALQAALTDAQTAVANPEATQSEVDAALTALTAAKNALVKAPVPVNKGTLAVIIAAATALTAADYTTDSWAALQTVLNTANGIAADAGATQSAVDEAALALNTAMQSLVAAGTPPNKEVLIAAIAIAETLNAADYTDSSWAPFAAALADARATLANAGATQSEVDAAAAALASAQGWLERAYVIIPDRSNPNNSYVKGSGAALVITCDGDFANFVDLFVNGVLLERDRHYVATPGSTIITFNQDYLNSLAAGTYNVMFLYENDSVFSQLAITEASTPLAPSDQSETPPAQSSTAPPTGDDSNMMGWLVVMVIAALGAVSLLLWNKRRNAKTGHAL